MNLGHEIRSARRSIGITQAELAALAGIAERTVHALEKNEGSSCSLELVVSALGILFVGLPVKETWGGRCRTLRKRKELSLAALSTASGVSVPALIRLERDEPVHLATLSAVLRVLAPNSRRKLPQRTGLGIRSERDDRFTPAEFFSRLERLVGGFDLDPCGHPESLVSAKSYFYGPGHVDGLAAEWNGKAYVNPPYSLAQAFTRKCHDEWQSGRCDLVIALLPARTHRKAFQRYAAGVADLFFLSENVRFMKGDKLMGDRAPFGMLLAVWGGSADLTEGIRSEFPSFHVPRAQGRLPQDG